MEISKMLTISTAHITYNTAQLIDVDDYCNRFPILSIYRKNDYGWFIYFDTAELDEAARGRIPADLMTCIDLAVKNGCSILCLDQDGDECDLPQYDWDDEDAAPVESLDGQNTEKSKSDTEYENIEIISYNRFCWLWLASQGFSVRDLITALAECIDEISECYETVGAADLCAFFEIYYLECHNLDFALEELSDTSMNSFILKVAECANVHLLGIGEDVDSDELIDLFENTGLGNGSLYPCLDEFLGAEYQDAKLMRQLLTDQEYAEYQTM